MSHTPGPWEVSTWADDGTASGVYQESIETGDDESDICDFDRNESPEVRMANARLISAAPDLLAACERALACCYDKNSEDGRQLQAAIAKAKGIVTSPTA